jgi:hypothetical protein
MSRRLKKIAKLEAKLEGLGRYIVMSIDRDDVGDYVPGRTKSERRAIAESVAVDLSNNELGNLPLTEAMEYAGKELDA